MPHYNLIRDRETSCNSQIVSSTNINNKNINTITKCSYRNKIAQHVTKMNEIDKT